MQLADRLSLVESTLSDSNSQSLSGFNQSVYQRLKKSLSLNLRRQIFLAVCDDLALRNRLAAQLYAELAYPPQPSPLAVHTSVPQRGSASVASDRILAETLAVEPSLSLLYPRLVSLNLNPGNPDPVAQIAQWLVQYPPPKGIYHPIDPPGFQILGVERLTRQPARVQKQFLNSLQQIEKVLPNLEYSLLLWLPRPWLHVVQQSAPAFWNWRTALFEFEGDPTPVPAGTFMGNADLHASAPLPDGTAQSPKLPVSPGDRCRETSSTLESVTERKPGQKDARTPGQRDAEKLEYPQPHGAVAKGWVPQATPTRKPAQQPASPASPADQAAPGLPPSPSSHPIVLPYPPHSVQDLANLVMAIALREDSEASAGEHSDLILALEQIQQLHRQQAASSDLAEAYQTLGNLYRNRVEQGEDSESTLLVAISAYELAVQWLDQCSPLAADVLNDIGNLYWMLSRGARDTGKAQSSLERAIAAYQCSLSQINPQSCPHNYAMTQNNLGSAYGDLARYRSPAEALKQSVHAYEEALRYRQQEDDPARYAATQNNLGTAYWNLAQHHQPVLCLKRAIAAYTEALHYYRPEREPLYYAMIQNNLGTAYWNLAQHKQSAPDMVAAWGEGEEAGTPGYGDTEKGVKPASPSDWLHRAISAYQAALTYRTVETAPAAHAATQNNLGTAHWHLANLSGTPVNERREHLQQAIAAYTAALTAIKPLLNGKEQAPALTFDPSATHTNLALAHYQIATDKHKQEQDINRSTHLEAALHHHLQALQGWQQNPDLYQTVLGYVVQTVRTFYSELGTKGENLAFSKIPAQLLPEIMKRL